MYPNPRLTHQAKMIFFDKGKSIFDLKITPFLKKLRTMNKNAKIIHCDNSGKNKTIEKCALKPEEINF